MNDVNDLFSKALHYKNNVFITIFMNIFCTSCAASKLIFRKCKLDLSVVGEFTSILYLHKHFCYTRFYPASAIDTDILWLASNYHC